MHLAAAILVFFLLRRHFTNPWVATVGAIFFGVHPVHVESVAWISGASDSLAALGILGCLLLWKPNTAPGSAWRRAASLECYAVALLVKETAIVVPALIFLYDLLDVNPSYAASSADASEPAAAPGNRSENVSRAPHGFARAIRRTLPFVGITALYFVARIAMLGGFRVGVPWLSMHDMLLTVPALLVFYLRHLLRPVKLSILYDFLPVSSVLDPRFCLHDCPLRGRKFCRVVCGDLLASLP